MGGEKEKLIQLLGEQREVVLAGRAGTGKTSLVREILDATQRPVTMLAPTARAARRLVEVTGKPATTIHSALYGAPEENEIGDLLWPEPRPIGEGGGIVAVDESSMVGHAIAEDIRKSVKDADATILWIGDPYQLPPVDDFVGCDLKNPDVLLTKVWRSSNGIMQFAEAILACETEKQLVECIRFAHQRFAGVCRAPAEWTPGRWRATAGSRGALLTFTNTVRHRLNDETRKALGYPPDQLVPGKELLLVRTNHRATGLLNGETYILEEEIAEDPDMPGHLIQVRLRDTLFDRAVHAYLSPQEFTADSRQFRERRREDSITWGFRLRAPPPLKNPRWIDQARRMDEEGVRGLIGPAALTVHANFGYAFTCHSAQGGEHDAIGIVWDGWWYMKRNFEEARSWWYTAVTRARQGVVIWFV